MNQSRKQSSHTTLETILHEHSLTHRRNNLPVWASPMKPPMLLPRKVFTFAFWHTLTFFLNLAGLCVLPLSSFVDVNEDLDFPSWPHWYQQHQHLVPKIQRGTVHRILSFHINKLSWDAMKSDVGKSILIFGDYLWSQYFPIYIALLS